MVGLEGREKVGAQSAPVAVTRDYDRSFHVSEGFRFV